MPSYKFFDSSHLIRPDYLIGLFPIIFNNFRIRLAILASEEIAPGNLMGHRPQGVISNMRES